MLQLAGLALVHALPPPEMQHHFYKRRQLEGLRGGFLPTERKKVIKLPPVGVFMARGWTAHLASG